MVESVRTRAIATGRHTPSEWAAGIRDLQRSDEPGGTFHYTPAYGVGDRDLGRLVSDLRAIS
jgi:hypothetical protein